MRGGALVGVFDQALLEDHRMRRVDDRQPRQARIAAQRRAPGDRAAPVVADQRERSSPSASASAKMSSISRSVLYRFDVLRQVRSGKAALVGHDQEKVVLEPRRDLAPGAVRFGKAVEQDHGRIRRIAGKRDVERDPGARAQSAGTRSRIADRRGTSGSGMNSWSSPGISAKRSAFQSSFAWLIRSRDEETKFQKT